MWVDIGGVRSSSRLGAFFIVGGYGVGGCSGGGPYPADILMHPPLLVVGSMVECIDDFVFVDH